MVAENLPPSDAIPRLGGFSCNLISTVDIDFGENLVKSENLALTGIYPPIYAAFYHSQKRVLYCRIILCTPLFNIDFFSSLKNIVLLT